jgi:hypothetical protein
MNLQEQISRIQSMMGAINESDIPLIIRRRVSAENIEEAFESALDRMGGSMENPNSVIYKEKGTTLRLFAKFVIDEMVTYLEQDYFTDDNRIYFEDDDFYYDKIRKPLLRHYGGRIKERYNQIVGSMSDNLQEHKRRVLQEETNYLRMITRRLPPYQLYDLDKDFRSSLNYISKMFVNQYKAKSSNLSEKEFIRAVIVDLISIIELRRYFPDNVEWYENSVDALSKHYKKRIIQMYKALKRE